MNFFFNDDTIRSPRTCFAVEPGYQQFPATCKLTLGHEGAHEAGADHYGGKKTWHDHETLNYGDVK